MECNYPALLVSGVVSLLIGALWYSKFLFGPAWQKSLGLKDEDLRKNMALIFGLSFVLSMVLAFGLGMYAGYHEPEEQTFVHGAFHASLSFVFFGLPVIGINSLYNRNTLVYTLINLGYWALTFMIIGGIMYAWPK
jgi:hypothetical protein